MSMRNAFFGILRKSTRAIRYGKFSGKSISIVDNIDTGWSARCRQSYLYFWTPLYLVNIIFANVEAIKCVLLQRIASLITKFSVVYTTQALWMLSIVAWCLFTGSWHSFVCCWCDASTGFHTADAVCRYWCWFWCSNNLFFYVTWTLYA